MYRWWPGHGDRIRKNIVIIDEYYFWFLRHGMGKTGRGFEKVIDVTDELRLKVENLIDIKKVLLYILSIPVNEVFINGVN